jgi:hypothetical protein
MDKPIKIIEPQYGLTDPKKEKLIMEETPPEYIKEKPGRGGFKLKYVETGYMIDRLNKIFNYMWSFEVVEKTQNQSLTQVQVRGRLTGYIVIPTTPPIVQAIVKEQYGGSDIKRFGQGHPLAGSPMDIADDYKSATSDALKKCASMLGIAADLYWKSYEIPKVEKSPFPEVKPDTDESVNPF